MNLINRLSEPQLLAVKCAARPSTKGLKSREVMVSDNLHGRLMEFEIEKEIGRQALMKEERRRTSCI